MCSCVERLIRISNQTLSFGAPKTSKKILFQVLENFKCIFTSGGTAAEGFWVIEFGTVLFSATEKRQVEDKELLGWSLV